MDELYCSLCLFISTSVKFSSILASEISRKRQVLKNTVFSFEKLWFATWPIYIGWFSRIFPVLEEKSHPLVHLENSVLFYIFISKSFVYIKVL